MTYPTRVRPRTSATLVATRRLVLWGALVAGLLPACSDDAANTDDIAGTPSTGTQTSTTGGFTSVTTGNTTSTTSGTSAGTGTSSANTTGSRTTTTGGAQTSSSSSSSSSLGSTTGGTTGGAGGAGGTSTASTETTTGGTGGTGSSGFQPCPETGPCKILPLGDSITVGLNFDGGYRVELFRLALEGGHEITFTGTQPPNGPNMVDGVTFPRNHEGISGQLIAEIGNRIPSPGLNEMPHIILVHAGTNDMARSRAGAEMRLEALMDKLIAEAPDALIVVSNLIPLPLASDAVDEFNGSVPAMVEERANAGAHMIFADQFTGFPESDLPDNVHPNEAGYNRMGGVWFEAIEPYLR